MGVTYWDNWHAERKSYRLKDVIRKRSDYSITTTTIYLQGKLGNSTEWYYWMILLNDPKLLNDPNTRNVIPTVSTVCHSLSRYGGLETELKSLCFVVVFWVYVNLCTVRVRSLYFPIVKAWIKRRTLPPVSGRQWGSDLAWRRRYPVYLKVAYFTGLSGCSSHCKIIPHKSLIIST